MKSVVIPSFVLGVAVLLSACGQSGALQLRSDPNYDQRAKYLLYPNPLTKKQENEVNTEQTPSNHLQSDKGGE